ncbi:hypothetical protein P3L10_000554 [Capsicum annuum]
MSFGDIPKELGNLTELNDFYLNMNNLSGSIPPELGSMASLQGLGYLRSSEPDKPSMVHRNISVEKVLLDQQFTPLILDCGLLKLLADVVVYSALKKRAMYNLQVLSGKGLVDCSMRRAAESCSSLIQISREHSLYVKQLALLMIQITGPSMALVNEELNMSLALAEKGTKCKQRKFNPKKTVSDTLVFLEWIKVKILL